MPTRWGKQIEETLASFKPSDVDRVWNGTSWQHLIFMAAGLDPFGEAQGEPPEPEERGRAVVLVRRALEAVRERSLASLKEWEAQSGPIDPDLRERIQSMGLEEFLDKLAEQVAAIDEDERIGIDVGQRTQAIGGPENLRIARLMIVAKDVADAYESSPIEPLSMERLQEAFRKGGRRR